VERVKCGVRSLRRELIFIRLIKYGSGASAACYETVNLARSDTIRSSAPSDLVLGSFDEYFETFFH